MTTTARGDDEHDGEPPRPEMSDTDAMMLCIVASEAFGDLPFDELSPEMRLGALLLFQKMVTTAKNALPMTAGLDHVRSMIHKAEQTAALIRRRFEIPELH